jgi:hypothetical protein
MEDRTLDAVDTVLFEAVRPRRCCSEVKGSDQASASSYELQAKSGPDEPQPTGHHEGVPLYALVLAQLHFLSSLCLLTKESLRHYQFTSTRTSLPAGATWRWTQIATSYCT